MVGKMSTKLIRSRCGSDEFSPNTCKAKAGRSLRSRPALSTECDPDKTVRLSEKIKGIRIRMGTGQNRKERTA